MNGEHRLQATNEVEWGITKGILVACTILPKGKAKLGVPVFRIPIEQFFDHSD